MPLSALKSLHRSDIEVERSIKRLRWFRRVYLEQVSAVTHETGIGFDVDTACLTEAHLEWSDALERQKPSDGAERRRIVDLSTGLMLNKLLQSAPLAARGANASAAADSPASYWPEGYVHVAFCLSVRQAVLRQEFDEDAGAGPAFDDLQSWQCFHEDAVKEPGIAAAYLQLFAGPEPNRQMPAESWPPGRQQSKNLRQLRLVRGGYDSPSFRNAAVANMARPALPGSIRRAIVDLSTICNSRAIVIEELADTIASHGFSASENELERLADRPLAAALTDIALRKGQICPGNTSQLFEKGLNQRARRKLHADDNARNALQELLDEGASLTIVTSQLERHLSDLPELLGIACESGPVEVLSKPLDQLHFGESTEEILFLGSNPAQLHLANKMGLFTVAVDNRGIQVADIELPDFSAFPSRS